MADDPREKPTPALPSRRRAARLTPEILDHQLVRCIGEGAYGEVWLAKSVMGTFRAVKVVYRDTFKDERPYEREFAGIKAFEPISRSNEGLVDILQIGRNDEAGYFYYVMELADDAESPHGVAADVRRLDSNSALRTPHSAFEVSL